MVRSFIKAKHDRLFTGSILGLIQDLSHKSTFYIVTQESRAACPSCGYDEVHDASNGVYNGTGPVPFAGSSCPTCNGTYWIENLRRQKVDASVQWGKASNEPNRVLRAGELPQDIARIKMPVKFYANVLAALYFIVDGDRCSIIGRPERRGLKSKVVVELLVKRDL